jgi:hypothetical protein
VKHDQPVELKKYYLCNGEELRETQKGVPNNLFSGQGVGIATARAGNVIGGGDWAETGFFQMQYVRGLEMKHLLFALPKRSTSGNMS